MARDASIVRTSATPDRETLALREEIEALRGENAKLRADAAAASLRETATGQATILEAFFRHTQTCLVLLDRDFDFVRVNDAYARACGRDAAEFVGRNHFELYPSPLVEDFRRVVAEKKPWSIAARPFVFPDHPEWGTTYWDLALVPILDGHGAVEHLVFSLHDVTPILRAEEALRQTEARLAEAQKMESIGRLAGGVAHDFNNLLMVIDGLTTMTIRTLGDDHPLTPDLRTVLKPVLASLNEVVSGMEPILRRLVGDDVDLELVLAPDLFDVRVDPSQMEQVVMNLAINARDAMLRDGVVRVTTKNVPGGSEEARAAGLDDRDGVVLSVTDDGEGMDEATRARVFEPFFTTKEVRKGTGLGLATVHGIVRQSGGNVTVRSAPGKGATFDVWLPGFAHGAPRDEPSRRRDATATGHATVLVVEDEDAVRMLVERALRSAGYDVLTAATGADALAVCRGRETPIDLLVTDVIMPGMSGPDLAAELAREQLCRRVIYMSGHTSDALPKDAGARLLDKPVSPDALVQRVREAVGDA